MLDKESLEDFAPVLSLCGSSPGAKSKLGNDDKGCSVAAFSEGSTSGAGSLSAASGFGTDSARGAFGALVGGGGAREAKHRADWETRLRRTADLSKSDEYILEIPVRWYDRRFVRLS